MITLGLIVGRAHARPCSLRGPLMTRGGYRRKFGRHFFLLTTGRPDGMPLPSAIARAEPVGAKDDDREKLSALRCHWDVRTLASSRASMKSLRRCRARLSAIRRTHPGTAQNPRKSLPAAEHEALCREANPRGGDLWITEFVLTYDDVPSYSVGIM